ncbi:MAG TPA: hypothetical protein PLI27_02630 [Ignavibacteriales bacterium]|nr:hypothetical protein [Ignavibacteriales bacterium]HOL82180.1 hypothetical protein [Ignavibacteriales bacterium]HOM65759.1 hypothetical protein [Ignavibacteriales bacterium]HPD66959.1 hypothetical protein [Ignavibacteriales bacterium]HPP34307.1 hypothetical protein [Ignavibacteriales bacterium]
MFSFFKKLKDKTINLFKKPIIQKVIETINKKYSHIGTITSLNIYKNKQTIEAYVNLNGEHQNTLVEIKYTILSTNTYFDEIVYLQIKNIYTSKPWLNSLIQTLVKEANYQLPKFEIPPISKSLFVD